MNPAASASPEPLLAGFTICDFTRVLSGPYCTRLLADFGAEMKLHRSEGFLEFLNCDGGLAQLVL